MADANAVELSPAHSPKPASIKSFEEILPTLKNEFHKMRLNWDGHEPQMFARVQHRTDHQLLEGVNVEKDLVQVKTGETSYGLHLFGKLKLADVDDAFIHVRLFVTDKEVKFHAIRKQENLVSGRFNAIFHEKDPLEWF